MDRPNENAQPSPGPWTVRDTGTSVRVETAETDTPLGPGRYSWIIGSGAGPADWANARLIAAAPETAAARDLAHRALEEIERLTRPANLHDEGEIRRKVHAIATAARDDRPR